MPMFEIYATGSYTYTKRIEAETQEEAEIIFYSDEPEICHQCKNEGLELDALSTKPVIEEIEDDEE